MPTRERRENITINSEKRGVIAVQVTFVEILSEQVGKRGEVVDKQVVSVVASGNLTAYEKDILAEWLLSPCRLKPDFL
jgi:hypothetical protein